MVAPTHLQRLCDQPRHTVNMASTPCFYIVNLFSASAAFRRGQNEISTSISTSVPGCRAQCTSPGKVLLAFLPTPARDDILSTGSRCSSSCPRTRSPRRWRSAGGAQPGPGATGIGANNLQELAYGLRSGRRAGARRDRRGGRSRSTSPPTTLSPRSTISSRASGPVDAATRCRDLREPRKATAPPDGRDILRPPEPDGGSRRAELEQPCGGGNDSRLRNREDRDHERAVIGLAKLPAVGQRAVQEAERRGADHRTGAGSPCRRAPR